MTLRFGWEPVRRVIEEPNFADLVRSHWEEAGVLKERLPLDLDTDRMIVLAAQGLYRAWVARDGSTLAGYAAFSFVPSMHHKSARMAYEDAFAMAPEYRRGGAGYALLASAFDALRESGVKIVVCQVPDRLNILFDRLGCETAGRIRIKVW